MGGGWFIYSISWLLLVLIMFLRDELLVNAKRVVCVCVCVSASTCSETGVENELSDNEKRQSSVRK